MRDYGHGPDDRTGDKLMRSLPQRQNRGRPAHLPLFAAIANDPFITPTPSQLPQKCSPRCRKFPLDTNAPDKWVRRFPMHWRRSPRALLIASTAPPLNNTAAPSRPRDTAIGTIVRQSRAWGRKRPLDREATLVWRTSFEAALSVGGSYAELGQGHTVSGQPWS